MKSQSSDSETAVRGSCCAWGCARGWMEAGVNSAWRNQSSPSMPCPIGIFVWFILVSPPWMCCKSNCVPHPPSLPLPSPPPHKLEGQKVGWYLRIMVAEGEGGRQLASSAPICFSERGKENAEDVMPEWLTLQQKGRLKVKLVNVLLISNCHTPAFCFPLTPPSHFSVALYSEGGREKSVVCTPGTLQKSM